MSAVNGKKDEVEPNNNVNNNNKENGTSVVLETNLDDTPPASDSAGGEEDNLQVSSIIWGPSKGGLLQNSWTEIMNFSLFSHVHFIFPPAGFLKDLEGDKVHVLVLFFLYVLQVKSVKVVDLTKIKVPRTPLIYCHL